MDPARSRRAGKQRASLSPSSATDQQLESPQVEASPHASTASLPKAAPSHHDKPSLPAPSKVAIRRLRRDSDSRSAPKVSPVTDKNRVSHACEPCRQRKTKCSGERPRCQHCEDFHLPCMYADGKRDKTRKEIGSLAERLEDYEQLLEELSMRDITPEADEPTTSSGQRSGSNREPAGEHKARARAGSTESLDRANEDYSRTSATRATGYYGKNSEVTWMQRLKRLTVEDSDDEDKSDSDNQRGWLPDVHTSLTHHHEDHGSGLVPVSESSYHLDDMALTLPHHVDPFEFPPQATANMLFQNYLQSVHPAFPIIGKTTFLSQYKAFQLSQDHSKINQSWLAILNLIFAIGAKYSHLIQAESSDDQLDHLVYFTRARILGFNSDAILSHADLQTVQITGLMSFYLMALNQINRSWATSGIAIRHASTLALNLRNDSKDIPHTSKEIRYRVWWALCSLERLLAVMTGRLPSFSETDCTTPMPLPVEEESFIGDDGPSEQDLEMIRSWSGQDVRQTEAGSRSPGAQEWKQAVPLSNALYFQFHTKLGAFSLEVLHRLYRVSSMSKSWADVLSAIANLSSKLGRWRAELPNVFDFTKRQRDQEFKRQRMSLGFSYYSILAIITRPCLCRLDRKIPNQSGKAKDSNREYARKCVYAAQDMLEMLPTEPNAVGLYKVAPWWCLVHHLTQAATVLMLELSFRSDHMPNEAGEIFDSAIKAVDWLRSLSKKDEAAKRAWSLCDDMLRKVAPKIGRSPAEASRHRDVAQPHSSGPATDHQAPDHHHQTADMDTEPFAQNPATSYPLQQNYASLAPFPPPIFSYYDQYLPYGQLPATSSASGPYNDMFATASEMDMAQDFSGYIDEQGQQQWYPGGGGPAG